jgi:hypothetical protein
MADKNYLGHLGTLSWVQRVCRSDLAHACGCLARVGHNPGKGHWRLLQHCARYLHGTQDMGLVYERRSDASTTAVTLEGWTDPDFAPNYVLGPVPGVDVMTKRSQGWVKCEDRLPYYRDISCSLPLPRLHDHNSTLHDSRGPRGEGGGARGKGPARVGLLGLQCSARALFRAASFKKKMTRASHLWTK